MKVKVCILTGCADCEEFLTRRVFSNEELAQDYLDKLSEDGKIHTDCFMINEYELDFINGEFLTLKEGKYEKS